MTRIDPDLTGQETPREGEPTPRQVRAAMRALHESGHDFTYKQAWALVRAATRREQAAAERTKLFDLLEQILGPSPMQSLIDAKHEIDHAIAHYRA